MVAKKRGAKRAPARKVLLGSGKKTPVRVWDKKVKKSTRRMPPRQDPS